MDGWSHLKTFLSEGEARVVESFLLAQGIEVKLLDTHSKYTHISPGRGQFAGLRMIVRESDLDAARDLLAESERGQFNLVDGEVPPGVPPRVTLGRERWIVLGVVGLFVLMLLLQWL
jgi:hypothetical protein